MAVSIINNYYFLNIKKLFISRLDKHKHENKELNVAGKINVNNKFKTNSEKTDWNKLKDDKKKLKLKRKQNHSLFELSVQAKKIYEKLKW